jgi:hypothetical protein
VGPLPLLPLLLPPVPPPLLLPLPLLPLLLLLPGGGCEGGVVDVGAVEVPPLLPEDEPAEC